MQSKTFRRFLLSAAITVSLSADALAAERYIIPIWAQDLRGGDQQWMSRLIVTNPAAEPVTVNVGPTFPLVDDPCRNVCGSPELTFTLRGKESASVAAFLDARGRRMRAGAFALESSGPLVIDHMDGSTRERGERGRSATLHRGLAAAAYALRRRAMRDAPDLSPATLAGELRLHRDFLSVRQYGRRPLREHCVAITAQ